MIHGISHTEIGKELDIPTGTVDSFPRHIQERQSVGNLPRSKCSRKTSLQKDRYIPTALVNT
jgi:hypothetical protein